MLYFVRHGATDWNDFVDDSGQKAPKCQGRADISLNERGIMQAQQVGQQLKDVKFDIILCSPLKRAKQTLKIMLDGKNAKFKVDERLIERDFGEFEGLTRRQFDFDGFWNSKSNQKFKRAESISFLQKRVFSLLDELSNMPNKNILIVSHGGVGLVVRTYFEGVPVDGNYLKNETPPGQPMIFSFNKQ